MKYANCHLHSTFSDAQFTPEQLVLIGKSLGYQAIALTDHETDGGCKRLFRAARAEGMEAISGVEFYGMEDGLCLAASLVVKALDAGGICAFGANCSTLDGRQKVEFPVRGGDVHKNDILREMSKIRAIDGASFASILAADIAIGITNSEVFIITSYVDESISEQVSLLEHMGNTVRIISLAHTE